MEIIQENVRKNQSHMFIDIEELLQDKSSSKDRQMLIKALTPLGEHLLNNGFTNTHDFYTIFNISASILKIILKIFYKENEQRMGICLKNRNFNKINRSDMNLLFTYMAYTNPQLMKDFSEYIKLYNINLKTPKQNKDFDDNLCHEIDKVSSITNNDDRNHLIDKNDNIHINMEIDDNVSSTYEMDENDILNDEMFNNYYDWS